MSQNSLSPKIAARLEELWRHHAGRSPKQGARFAGGGPDGSSHETGSNPVKIRSGPSLPERTVLSRIGPAWASRLNAPAVHVGVLILAAIALRSWYLWQYGHNLPFLGSVLGDSEYYDTWARRVAAGEGYGPAPYYTGPLYPYLLGLFYAAAGPSPRTVPFVQAAVGVLSILLVYALGRSLFGHVAGLLAAAMALFYAPLPFLESKILTETLAIALNCLAVLLLTASLRRDSSAGFLAAGAAIGAAALCRPGTLLAAALILVWLTLRHPLRRACRWPRRAGLVAAGLALAILPVTLRNYLAGGDLVLISTNGGTTFLYGNNPASGGVMVPPPGFSGVMRRQQQEETAIAERALGRRLTPSETSRYSFAQGLRVALADPAQYLKLLAWKTLWFVHAREVPDTFLHDVYLERRYVPALGVLFLPFPLIAVFALFGIAFLRSPRAVLLSAPALLFCGAIFATTIIFSVNSRYRAPIVPLLAVFGAHGVLSLSRALRRENVRRSAGVAILSLAVLSASLVPFPWPRISVDALNNLGARFAHAGNWEAGRSAFEEALRLEPGNPSVLSNLGQLFLETGRTREAIGTFRELIRVQPDNVQAHKSLEIALSRSGQHVEPLRGAE